MARNLKALGLALFATCAMSAVAAASASAVTHTFSSAVETTHLTAEAEGTQTFWATTNDANKHVDCTSVNVANSTIVGKNVASVTVEPIYTGCTVFDTGAGKEATAFVETNKCHYTFTGETASGVTTGEHAQVRIKCAPDADATTGAGTHIELKATALKLKCISVPSQEVRGIKYTNKQTAGKKEEITIEATVHGIKSTTTNSVACPTTSGLTEEHTDGKYTGNVTVRGFSDVNDTTQTDVTVTPGL
jgi:hypothetical protein